MPRRETESHSLQDSTRGTSCLAASGENGKRIWICGPREATIDSGGHKNGYGLHITGSYVGVWGLTVSNAQKGIVIDGGDFVQIDFVEVHTIGDEAIHFRGTATDGVVQDSLVHHTGLRRDKFGEGIYVGSAVSNWGKITNGEPDKSDRIAILRNRIWDTTAESIDLKEGTSDGRVEFNSFDGSRLIGADSWVDVKGNNYLVQGNVGVTSPEDGFQTHNIDDLGWGQDNRFIANTAQVSGPGYGFLHPILAGSLRSRSPTAHSSAISGSIDTSANSDSASTIASRWRRSSTVTDTLTSEVVTTSTAVVKRSNTSNTAAESRTPSACGST